MSSLLRDRDGRVHGQVDFAPGSTARQIADYLRLTPGAVYASLSRLRGQGLVVRAPGWPAPWYLDLEAVPDTDEVEVTLTAGDCRFVVHMLRGALAAGTAGPPTEALVMRIERAMVGRNSHE